MAEFTIENKKSLNTEKLVDRILAGVLIIFCIVLTVMGIDIEKKLKKLNETVPVIGTVQATDTVTNNFYSEFSNTSTQTTVSYAVPSLPEQTTSSDITTQTPTAIYETTSSSAYNLTTQSPEATAASSVSDSQIGAYTATQTTPPNTSYFYKTENNKADDGKYYVTASGSKYHLNTCSYLSKTKIEISLDEALLKGYKPCSRCISE